MKIALFSATINSYEVTRLVETADRLGHELSLVPYQALIISLSAEEGIDLRVGSNVARYREEAEAFGHAHAIADADFDLAGVDAALTRSANRAREPMRANYAILLHSYFQKRGIPMLNGHSYTLKDSNKLWQTRILLEAGLPVVPTRFIAHEDLLAEGVADQSWPLFAKDNAGTHGQGAGAVDSEAALREAYAESKQSPYLLVQKLLGTRSDLRVLVLGDQALGAIQRTAVDGSDVTNISAGGEAEAVSLSAEEADLAVRAARAMSLEFCGVDLMRDQGGDLYILETNKNPQFHGFEAETELDVPQAIFAYLEGLTKNGAREIVPDAV